MGMPVRQSMRIGSYILANKLRRREIGRASCRERV